MTEASPSEAEVAMTPEELAADAVSKVEGRDMADPVTGAEWVQKAKGYAKGFAKKSGAVIGISLLALGVLVWREAKGIYKFAKKAIQKGGNVGFSEGFEIGKEVFSFGDKKDKK